MNKELQNLINNKVKQFEESQEKKSGVDILERNFFRQSLIRVAEVAILVGQLKEKVEQIEKLKN